MNTIVISLLAVTVALLFLLLYISTRRGGATGVALLQQQLIELRQRLDALTSVQSEVPRALAEGSAEQLRSLADVREQLVRVSEATARLEEIGKSVADVQELLKVPRLRGTLGELWLEELLRQVFPSGFYELQHEFRSGERVDAVIKLGGRFVPVDSKFPLEACQRMLKANGDQAERERSTFRRSLKDRVDEIADKYIRPEEGTYEFAFMYIPAENVYYEAVIRDERLDDHSSLVGYALDRKVIPVSPNTFYAYLVVILHGLQGLEVEDRASEIMDSLRGLEQHVDRFAKGYELVGRHLTNAVKQFDASGRQLQSVKERIAGVTTVGRSGDDPV